MEAVFAAWTAFGLTKEACSLAWARLAPQTHKNYDTAWRAFKRFCDERALDPSQDDQVAVANFAAWLQARQGGSRRGYVSAVKTTLSLMHDKQAALQAVQTGVSKKRPDKARYADIWDVRLVWEEFKTTPWAELDLNAKRDRLVVSLSLDTMCRGGDLANLFREKLVFEKQGTRATGVRMRFYNPKESKYTGVSVEGRWSREIYVQAYPACKELCSVWMLQQWLEITQDTVKQGASEAEIEDGTVLSLTPVFCVLGDGARKGLAISPDFVRNCRKRVMAKAGIDLGLYKAHSTRHAACTAARLVGDESDQWLSIIMATGRWTSRGVMDKFYFKPTGRLVVRKPPFPRTVTEALRWSLRGSARRAAAS